MILSFNNALKSQEDNFADDSLKIDTINEIEELLSKQNIDNILDKNAENIFFKNVSTIQKNDSIKSDGNNYENKINDYLKKGSLDYSPDSNCQSIPEEKPKTDKERKKQKKQNFILKSELFSSADNDQKIKSEKLSHKSSVLNYYDDISLDKSWINNLNTINKEETKDPKLKEIENNLHNLSLGSSSFGNDYYYNNNNNKNFIPINENMGFNNINLNNFPNNNNINLNISKSKNIKNKGLNNNNNFNM